VAIVFEDDVSIAFLDRRPLFPGHTLLVTKNHYETLTDLPHALVPPIFSSTQVLAAAVVEATGSEGSFVAINNRVSQSVPHLHIHMVPRKKSDGLKGFFWPRHPYKSEGEMHETREAIRGVLHRLLQSPGASLQASSG
jgi:histidine triad (HIT) family protein